MVDAATNGQMGLATYNTQQNLVNATGPSTTRKERKVVRGWATCGDRGSSWFDEGIGGVLVKVVDVGS